MITDPVEDATARRAYRRVADPFGTPVRAVFLVLSLGWLGWYLTQLPPTPFRTVLGAVTAGAAVAYVAGSLRVRRLAAVEGTCGIRDRFLEKARARLRVSFQMWILAVFWAAVGVWGGFWILTAGPPETFGLFLAVMGGVLAARYLLERLVDVPRLRRDLAAIEAQEAPTPAG